MTIIEKQKKQFKLGPRPAQICGQILKKSPFKNILSLISNLMSRTTKNIYDKCQKILKPRSDAQNTFGLP